MLICDFYIIKQMPIFRRAYNWNLQPRSDLKKLFTRAFQRGIVHSFNPSGSTATSLESLKIEKVCVLHGEVQII